MHIYTLTHHGLNKNTRERGDESKGMRDNEGKKKKAWKEERRIKGWIKKRRLNLRQ
jgi:hypothetical protein